MTVWRVAAIRGETERAKLHLFSPTCLDDTGSKAWQVAGNGKIDAEKAGELFTYAVHDFQWGCELREENADKEKPDKVLLLGSLLCLAQSFIIALSLQRRPSEPLIAVPSVFDTDTYTSIKTCAAKIIELQPPQPLASVTGCSVRHGPNKDVINGSEEEGMEEKEG